MKLRLIGGGLLVGAAIGILIGMAIGRGQDPAATYSAGGCLLLAIVGGVAISTGLRQPPGG